MRIITVRTIYGELIGRVPDALTDEAILEHDFIPLERPVQLMIVPVPTPQGLQMVNTMVRITQTISPDELPIPRHHVVIFGETEEAPAREYMKMTTGIDLPAGPGAGGGLSLVRG